MGLDPDLAAAVAVERSRGLDPETFTTSDATHQLQLAQVLLDGGYDGVATLGEAMAGRDHGLGTVDRLDGELVVVDGEPWRIDHTGRAQLMPPDTRIPFLVVTTMHSPLTMPVHDASWDDLAAMITSIAGASDSVAAVRVEGVFDSVLLRSVRPQSPPYRPFAEVCQTDEVRWTIESFDGVMVGFSFPDLRTTDTIPGLHLHAVDRQRTTGGHVHDLHVRDAVLTISTDHEVVMHLADHSMADLLHNPRTVRIIQRALLRDGPQTTTQLASSLELSQSEAEERLKWLSDRGFVEQRDLDGGRWHVTMHTPARRASGPVADLLDSL